MDSVDLKRLRRKQLFAMNLAVVVTLCLLILWGGYITTYEFWIGMGVIFLIQGLTSIFGNMMFFDLVFPFLRRLRAYENEKLGKGAKRRFKKDGWMSFVMVFIAFFNVWSNWGEQTTMSFKDIWLSASIIFIAILIVLNFLHIAYNWKIDRS